MATAQRDMMKATAEVERLQNELAMEKDRNAHRPRVEDLNDALSKTSLLTMEVANLRRQKADGSMTPRPDWDRLGAAALGAQVRTDVLGGAGGAPPRRCRPPLRCRPRLTSLGLRTRSQKRCACTARIRTSLPSKLTPHGRLCRVSGGRLAVFAWLAKAEARGVPVPRRRRANAGPSSKAIADAMADAFERARSDCIMLRADKADLESRLEKLQASPAVVTCCDMLLFWCASPRLVRLAAVLRCCALAEARACAARRRSTRGCCRRRERLCRNSC